MTERDVINHAIRGNTGAWMETYGKIWPRDQTLGVMTPRLNHLQRKIQSVIDRFEELNLPVRIIGLKPRQRGSTTMFSALGYTKMRREPTSAIFIGGRYDQTVGLRNMLKTYWTHDKFNWGNTGVVNEKGATFANGSRAKYETAKDVQAGIGDTYNLAHLTEAARWTEYGISNSAEVMANLLKAVPLVPGSVIFIESTAQGVTGPFPERWNRSVDAEDFISGAVELEMGQYVRIFAGWQDFEESAIRLTEKQKQHIQNTLDSDPEYEGEKELLELYGHEEDGVMLLGTSAHSFDAWEKLAWRRYAIREECDRDKSIFDRDYPHSWRVAFQKSGTQRFNQTGLAIMRKRMATKNPTYGVLEEANGRLSFRQTDKNEAKIILFEKPQAGRRYILPIDPMTGASQTTGEDPDFHGVHILRDGYHDGSGKWVRTAQAARVVQNRWDIDVVFKTSWQLARYYGNKVGCKVAIEMNQDRGLTELFKQVSADLYMREVFNKLEFKTTSQLGFLTNEKTRENLIESLAEAIREWDTPGNGLDIFDETTMTQLENFVRKSNGRSEASGGFHDDDVLSIALGYHLKEHATTYWPQRGYENLPPDLQPIGQQRGQGLGGAFS